MASLNDRLFLTGHSAGGQLVSCYAVVHAQRVEAAVVSAAGAYAFPDPHTR